MEESANRCSLNLEKNLFSQLASCLKTNLIKVFGHYKKDHIYAHFLRVKISFL